MTEQRAWKIVLTGLRRYLRSYVSALREMETGVVGAVLVEGERRDGDERRLRRFRDVERYFFYLLNAAP
jgi:hypothetical protein